MVILYINFMIEGSNNGFMVINYCIYCSSRVESALLTMNGDPSSALFLKIIRRLIKRGRVYGILTHSVENN